MWRRFLAAATLATLWSGSAAAEDANAGIGVLTCVLGEPATATPSSDTSTGGQARDALCNFKPKSGAEEEYVGVVQGMSLSSDQKGALIWLVKRASEAPARAGVLQQNYESDVSKSVDQRPPLIGQTNTDIVLHSMADTKEGSASAADKPAPTGFIILGLELKLKSTSG